MIDHVRLIDFVKDPEEHNMMECWDGLEGLITEKIHLEKRRLHFYVNHKGHEIRDTIWTSDIRRLNGIEMYRHNHDVLDSCSDIHTRSYSRYPD